LSRAKGYANQQSIRDVQINQLPDEGVLHITARVKGTAKRPYRTDILVSFDDEDDSFFVEGDCSCPVGLNCKHVAATLLFIWQEDKNSNGLIPSFQPIDYPTQQWLDYFINTVNQNDATSSKDQILFILDKKQDRFANPLVLVSLMQARILKSGKFGKPKPLKLSQPNQTKKITPDILEIYYMLDIENDYESNGYEFVLMGLFGARALSKMVTLGNCYWQDVNSNPITLGDAKSAGIVWQTLPSGYQNAICDIANNHCIVLPTEPLWYVDIINNAAGPVKTKQASKVAASLLVAPPINPSQANQVAEQLQQKIQQTIDIPLPHTYTVKNTRKVKPTPELILEYERITDLMGSAHYFREKYALKHAIAKLVFHYDKMKVAAGAYQPQLERVEEGKLISIPRDKKTEAQWIKQLTKLKIKKLAKVRPDITYYENNIVIDGYFYIGDESNQEALINFSYHTVSQLEQAGFKVSFSPNYPYLAAVTPDEWYVDLEQQGDNEWFDLELGILVDGKKINLLPLLEDAVHTAKLHQQQLTLTLPEGRLVNLPEKRVQNILNTIAELYAEDNSGGLLKLTVSKHNASLLAELQQALEAVKLRWFGDKKLLELGKKLKNFTGINEANLPANFKATLRPYQQMGVNWLQFLKEYQLNGILADDMGLGKTIQTLAHISIEKSNDALKNPCLIIAPTSVVSNWEIEAQRFCPDLKVLVLHGSARQNYFDSLGQYDVIITSYALLVRDKKALLSQHFYQVILDEAQYIKNAQAKMTQIINQLNAPYRLCLTGTPLENHLGELWSLFHFLMPGLLHDAKTFNRKYRRPIEKAQDAQKQQALATLVKPFILRRTKDAVIKELPKKNEIICPIELSGEQRDLYENVRLAMHAKIKKAIKQKGLAKSHIIILDALLKLRQTCCDPRLLKLEAAKSVNDSAKLAALMEMLIEMVAEGRRILLFSQFTSMLSLIEKDLAETGIDYVKITGATKDRRTPIRRFQNKEVPLFLISLKSGGTGLNLTAADTVIHYDPWWNPAVENQATDRAHRIGQERTVFVYKLICKDTVEEKIIQMQQKKQALADGLLSGKNLDGKVSSKDFEYLFAASEKC
jgi:SNF2 family DNA or RNA helicase